jgi:hypothetical protein
VAAPAAPGASFTAPDVTLPASTINPVTVALAGVNIPPGTAVLIAVNGQTGGNTVTSTTLSGTLTSTTAMASVTIPTNRPSVVSASATFTLVATGGAPVYVDGQLVVSRPR